MKWSICMASAVLSLGLLSAGCDKHDHNNTGAGTGSNTAAPNTGTSGTTDPHAHMAAVAGATKATCDIEPTKGNKVKGTVKFTEEGGKVKVVADLTGLEPNSKHGFHVHEGTECGEDGMKAGGHYNPDKHDHGMPGSAMHHAGDFGNIEADKDGKAHLELTVDDITIAGAKNPVAGHAMIVHAKADDGGQPVGNAGARIACGIIKAEK